VLTTTLIDFFIFFKTLGISLAHFTNKMLQAFSTLSLYEHKANF